MSNNYSNSSSSSSDGLSGEFDDLMHEYFIIHLLNTPPPQHRSRTSCIVNENADKIATVDRNREEGHTRLYNDYFASNPVYKERQFRRQFRMKRPLFSRIMEKVVENDVYFQQRRNRAGKLGFSPLQKCTAAIRQLAYGYSADVVDEYLRMGETTALQSLKHFVQGVVLNFENEYLRTPTQEDVARTLYRNERRGFPGMIGSIDCMHWEWKNCPQAWQGQYSGRNKNPTLILEAVADQDLWIWHSFFGIPGSCNDLNVLYRSPVFDDVLQGIAPNANFAVNGHAYNLGYYLTDGIYPCWSTIVQGIMHPQTSKQRLFSDMQAAARKDVERAFGVLQARFAIVRHPARAHDEDMLIDIMKACIIMHNMIVEDERDTYEGAEVLRAYYESDIPERRSTISAPDTSAAMDAHQSFEFQTGQPVDINSYLNIRTNIRNRSTHDALKHDLMEHIWNEYGRNNV